MSSINDSLFILNDAKVQLTLIEKFYSSSLKEKHISPLLRLKIKHFLEDIRSSLDYAAFHIFTTLFKDKISSDLKHHERIISFPFRESEKKFDLYVSNAFPGLSEEKPDILIIFKELQAFNKNKNVEWFFNLNVLCNKNKHRHLVPQERKETSRIKYMVDNLGNTFTNIYMTDVKSLVEIDDIPIDLRKPNPFYHNVNIESWDEFYFEDFNQPVPQLLKGIYTGTESTVNKLISQL